MSFFELLNELVAVDVVGGEPVLSSHQTKGRGQVGFPHTGRSEKDHIFSVLDVYKRQAAGRRENDDA